MCNIKTITFEIRDRGPGCIVCCTDAEERETIEWCSILRLNKITHAVRTIYISGGILNEQDLRDIQLTDKLICEVDIHFEQNHTSNTLRQYMVKQYSNIDISRCEVHTLDANKNGCSEYSDESWDSDQDDESSDSDNDAA